MAKSEHFLDQLPAPIDGGKAYERPVLTEFGPIGALTQSGTQAMMESMGQPQRDPMA